MLLRRNSSIAIAAFRSVARCSCNKVSTSFPCERLDSTDPAKELPISAHNPTDSSQKGVKAVHDTLAHQTHRVLVKESHQRT